MRDHFENNGKKDEDEEDASQEQEPRLKYERFGSDVPEILGKQAASRLCISDKILALGAQNGTVYMLDYDGNEIKCYRQHGGPVTDLSFDASAESLASCASDGSLVVYGLCTEEVQRFKYRSPVTSVALEPRYASRKTKEFVYGTATGSLVLSSKGWLGNSETMLFQGRGRVLSVRMSGTLLAWATDTGVRVYDTSNHSRVGKLDRPPSCAGDPTAPCSLCWVGQRELLIGWALHVVVVAIVPAGAAAPPVTAAATPPAASRAVVPQWGLQVTASFEVDGCLVAGIAPFGTQLAVLAWMPGGGLAMGNSSREVSSSSGGARRRSIRQLHAPLPSERGAAADGGSDQDAAADGGAGSSTSENAAVAAHNRSCTSPAALKIMARSGQELFSDALDVRGIDPLSSKCQVQLAAYYTADAQAAAATKPPLPNGRTAPRLVPGTPSSVPATPSSTPAATPPPLASAALDSTPALPPDIVDSSLLSAHSAPQPYKWWRDGAEPLYYVLSPKDIVIGRPREGSDRIAWLAQRRRFAEALAVAEEDPGVRGGAREALGEQYLQYLVDSEQYHAAAELAPRVLRGDAAAWERWVYAFGQRRRLPLLAPRLPTVDPRLSSAAYDMALAALLRSPEDHHRLLALVECWPSGSYDAAALLSSVATRLRPSSAAATAASTAAVLKQVAAVLHTQLGHYEAALQLYLDLCLPAAFDYIKKYALLALAGSQAAALMEVDEVRATSLLVDNWEEVAPTQVVASLQQAAASLMPPPPAAAGAARAQATKSGYTAAAAAGHSSTRGAASAGGSGESEASAVAETAATVWRSRLHHYLDWLHRRDPAAAAPFAALQVELTATQDPSRLLHFLTTSADYPLDQALAVCEGAGLVRETVYVLGRMGAADRALRLIVGRLRDVEEAVAFVQEQRDEELWELLISLALGDSALVGALLDHAGGYVDPLRVVGAIPVGMSIENLKGRLVRIITDFRAHMSLAQGCNAVLKADCIQLADTLYQRLRRALRRLHVRAPGGGGGGERWLLYDAATGADSADDTAAVPGPLAAELALGSLGGSPAGTRRRGSRGASPAKELRQGVEVQQAKAKVWIGFSGSPPRRASFRPPPAVSPSKFAPLGPAGGRRQAPPPAN